jgi:hypothetical protein
MQEKEKGTVRKGRKKDVASKRILKKQMRGLKLQAKLKKREARPGNQRFAYTFDTVLKVEDGQRNRCSRDERREVTPRR